MRLPDSAHTGRLWRIHALTPDFRLEDVWALPTPGGPDDFPRLVAGVSAGGGSRSAPVVVRALWAVRWTLGRWLGWDAPREGLGSRVATLRDRLPDDLREGAAGPELAGLPFRPLYLTHDEFAAEIANGTMHGVLHLGWVPDGTGGHRGQMAVLVKPNGRMGAVYMTAIRPFRHRLVYPAMLREIGRAWRSGPGATAGRGD